jgi:hypothetical protein
MGVQQLRSSKDAEPHKAGGDKRIGRTSSDCFFSFIVSRLGGQGSGTPVSFSSCDDDSEEKHDADNSSYMLFFSDSSATRFFRNPKGLLYSGSCTQTP